MENDALDLFGEADKLEASIEEAAATLDKQKYMVLKLTKIIQ